MMTSRHHKALILSAVLSVIAALAHLACILGGGDWYRFMGAGEQMALMAERGDAYPTIVTSLLCVILFGWSAYALSGAKKLPKLPLLKTGLSAISAVLIFRGISGLFALFFVNNAYMQSHKTFMLVSSLICLLFGALFLYGTIGVFKSESTNKASLSTP